MTVDKEAISLSRVYSYDSKCTCPYSKLILSVSSLNEILIYFALEHINTTSMYTLC